MSNSLTAIIPILNEEGFLAESVNRLLQVEEISEVFLVDDCSTDNSLKIMKKIESENKRVKVFESPHPTNRGKGDTILRAREYIKSNYVVIHDADLEYNPQDIRKLFNSIKENQETFLIGSRFLKDKKVQHYYRTYLANTFLSWLFSIVHRKKVTDIATCYKLMPSTYFKQTNFEEPGFAIEIELVAKFLKKSKNILEVPISYSARTYEEGKKIRVMDGFKYIYAIFKYKFSY